LREDPVDASLVYLGTEFGLFLSFNAGGSWVPAHGNLPTVPVNDLVVHPRDHALVLGTHGRGIWILDDVRPLRNGRPGPKVVLSAGPTSVRQQRRVPKLGHTGDIHFRGENPVNGLPITVWAADSGLTATVSVSRVPGGEIWQQVLTTKRGLNTVVWNLRGAPLPAAGGGGDDDERPRGAGPSAFVRPGPYTVVVTWDGQVRGQRTVTVLPDARQDASPVVREAWHAALDSIEAMARRTAAALAQARAAAGPGAPAAATERAATLAELQQRVNALFSQLEAQVGAPTTDMRAQWSSYAALLARLERTP
nr:hypothetical protein [Gemmatimonadaceae bacterium]